MLYAKYDALDVSEYVLSYCENILNNPITNLQLQKILYYIQGKYIAKYKKPLFDNDMEAWSYGPVIPDVYYEYKNFVSNPITGIHSQVENLFDDDEIELIKNIVKKTYNTNVWELVNRTHRESPWKENYVPGLKKQIPMDDLIEFFQIK